MIGLVKAFEARVWATMPGVGSRKTRKVMAWRSRRQTICSLRPSICAAISAKDTSPSAGIMLAILKRVMV